MTKLTLSADHDLIEGAKQVAARRGTSLSSMFSRFMRAMVQEGCGGELRGPVTTRVLGLAHLPEGSSDRRLIEEALDERFGA